MPGTGNGVPVGGVRGLAGTWKDSVQGSALDAERPRGTTNDGGGEPVRVQPVKFPPELSWHHWPGFCPLGKDRPRSCQGRGQGISTREDQSSRETGPGWVRF